MGTTNTIALPSAPSDLVQALTGRGAHIVTGQDVRSAIASISPGLHDGSVASVLLVHGSDHEAELIEVWARSLAPFVSARFVGLGQWESADLCLEVGCSLADLVAALGLEPEDGDGSVTVGADGALDEGEADDGPAGQSAPSSVGPPSEGAPGQPWGTHPDPQRDESPAPFVPPAPDRAGERGTTFRPWGQGPSRGVLPRQADWSRVLFLISGRGGVGRSTMGIAVAERAASHLGRDVVLVDANTGQAGLATNLRAVRSGESSSLPTIADLRAGASVQHVVSGPQAVRRAGGTRVGFASVLAPDPDQATTEACSPDRYQQVIDELAQVSDLIVVDTCVAWQSDPTSITSGLVAPGLRDGASVLVVTDMSPEGVEGARRLVAWATRLAPGRVAGLLNKAPASAVPAVAEASRLFAPAPCLGVIPYSESIAVAAARGRPVGRLTGLAADKVLTHLGVA